jgi:hypothetical protein
MLSRQGPVSVGRELPPKTKRSGAAPTGEVRSKP